MEIRDKVGIVIVNYRSEQEIQRCLESLRHIWYSNYEIIIVDNSDCFSSRKKLFELKSKYNFNLIFSVSNIGFAAACNLGIANFIKNGANYIWLLNPDMIVSRNALSVLVEKSEKDKENSILGSRVLLGPENLESNLEEDYHQGREFKIWSVGGIVNFSGLQIDMPGHNEVDSSKYDQEQDFDYIAGCSLFFPISIIEKIGYLPEEYFLYYEETDWCLRAKQRSIKITYAPKSVVWHLFKPQKMQQSKTVYYYNRNNLYFWSKFTNLGLKLKLSVLFKRLPLVFYRCFKEEDEERRKGLLSHVFAYVDFLLGKMGMRENIR